MKRILFAILMICQIAVFGQYQIRNGNFEIWDSLGTSYEEPTNWSSHMNNTGSLASFARAQQIQRSTDTHTGTGYSCNIYARIAIGSVIANGTVTTGRINVGNISPANSANHTFTVIGDSNFNEPFTGRPDSIRFWAKFVCPNSSTQYAKMHAVIHGNYEYTDPETNNSSSFVVGKAVSEFQRGDEGWHQYTVSFDYDSYSSLNQTPAYILITITTNKNPGTGAATDNLYCDDIEMIYNARLSDLKVGGVSIGGFNPDITDYYISTPYCYGDTLPLITASTASSLASPPLITQANSSAPIATVMVTNGNVTKTYRVHFTIITTLHPTVNDENRCGPGSISLSAIPDTITNTCRWYDHITQGNLIYTGNVYSPTIYQTTTYYVSSYNPTLGCESERVAVTGFIYPVYQSDTIEVTICESGNYNFFGRLLTQPGIYDTVFSTTHGCDSLIILNLMVGNAYQNNLFAQICEGEIYQQNGFNADSTGIYTHTLTASNGCDSIVLVHLTVNPTYNITLFDTICQGSAYSVNGFNLPPQNLTGTTQHSLSLSSILGCDSLVNLSLTITPVYLFELYDTICSNNYYQWRGNNLNMPGIYYDSLLTENGCDSIFTLHLETLPLSSYTFAVSICDSYTWEDSTYYSSGEYTRTYSAANGCDSVVTLSLTILPEYIINIEDTVFSGEIYNQNGFSITTTAAGIIKDTLFLFSQGGCDSIITLNLTVITGIQENELSESILLYPNPSHSHIMISSGNENPILNIQIMDLAGKIVKQIVNVLIPEKEINISDLSPGTYIVRIFLKEGLISKKITVQ